MSKRKRLYSTVFAILAVTGVIVPMGARAERLHRVWVQTPEHCRMVVEAWSRTVDPSSDGSTATWNGSCQDGYATGSGLLDVVGPGGHYHFEGSMAQGLEQGHGTITLPTGNVLTGDFRMGMLDPPRVTYIDPQGMRYEGDWINGEENGHGKAVYANGTTYEGEWRDGHPTGRGILHSKGTIYTGEVKDGEPNGEGTLTASKGLTITRQWKGWLHNNGPVVVTNSTGDRYEGNAEDLRRARFGVLTRADGSIYWGQWADNKPDGPGVLIQADGTRYDGVWHAGCLKQDNLRVAFFPPAGGCP